MTDPSESDAQAQGLKRHAHAALWLAYPGGCVAWIVAGGLLGIGSALVADTPEAGLVALALLLVAAPIALSPSLGALVVALRVALRGRGRTRWLGIAAAAGSLAVPGLAIGGLVVLVSVTSALGAIFGALFIGAAALGH